MKKKIIQKKKDERPSMNNIRYGEKNLESINHFSVACLEEKNISHTIKSSNFIMHFTILFSSTDIDKVFIIESSIDTNTMINIEKI